MDIHTQGSAASARVEFFDGEAAIAIENALLIKEKVEAERLAAIGVAVAGI